MNTGKPFTLAAEARQKLVERLKKGEAGPASRPAGPARADFTDTEAWRQMQIVRAASESLGIANPFYRVQESAGGTETIIDGKVCLNFSSYNYLGFNSDPQVAAAATDAIARYGASAAASRLTAGERPVHRMLEEKLAALHGTEDAVAFVSGHATNVTVIGSLFGKQDLILSDAFCHNSIQQGAILSGARRLSFPHNDVAAAERLLAEHRGGARRTLIVIESHYSMDGDVPDLPAFIALARRYQAMLMVDEAHGIGVLGRRGRGIAEHYDVDPREVDLWMGTLSKTLCGCGGYIAARADVIELLRYSAPGFVYSVGMPPPMAAASLAALALMENEPARIASLNANAALFLDLARKAGLNTGLSAGLAIVPIITGSSILAGRLSAALLEQGIFALPIIYPAVPENGARLRFFLSSQHTGAQIEQAVSAIRREMDRLSGEKPDPHAGVSGSGAC